MDQRNLQIVLSLQDQASKELKKFATNLDSSSKKTEGLGEGMKVLASTAKWAGAALIAASVATAGFGVSVASQLETAKVGMTTLLGSSKLAGDAIDRIKIEAARTPFELPGLTQAVQLLSSVTKDGQKSIDVILDIGEALAAMGKGQAELDRIIVNLQQVGAIGYASMVDIKQFAYAGIPIFEMLQKQTGLAGDALADFISQGGVTFDLLTTMFDKANDEGGQFFNSYKNNAGTFAQVTSNMKDSVGILASDIVLTTGAFDGIKSAMVAASKQMNSIDTALLKTASSGAKTADVGLALFKTFSFISEAAVNTGTGIMFLARSVVWLGSYLAQSIAMLNGWDEAEKQAFTNFRAEVAESIATSGQFALNLHEENQRTIADWGKASETITSLGTASEAGYGKLGNAATAASKEVVAANKAIEDTKKKILELQEAFKDDVKKQSTSYGEAVVAQEEKVKDLKLKVKDAEIAARKAKKDQEESDDDNRSVRQAEKALAEAQAEYDRERQALETRKILYTAYDDEIMEARRRNALTDFARELEDITKRGGELKKEFDKKMLLLQQELVENEKKRGALNVINKGITADMKLELNEQYNAVKSTVSSILIEYKKLKNSSTKSVNPFPTLSLVSKASARASGGPVTSGKPYVVGEQGPELFMPATNGNIIPNGALAMAGGGSVTVNVYGDVSGMELVERVKNAIADEIKRRQRLT